MYEKNVNSVQKQKFIEEVGELLQELRYQKKHDYTANSQAIDKIFDLWEASDFDSDDSSLELDEAQFLDDNHVWDGSSLYEYAQNGLADSEDAHNQVLGNAILKQFKDSPHDLKQVYMQIKNSGSEVVIEPIDDEVVYNLVMAVKDMLASVK